MIYEYSLKSQQISLTDKKFQSSISNKDKRTATASSSIEFKSVMLKMRKLANKWQNMRWERTNVQRSKNKIKEEITQMEEVLNSHDSLEK